MSFEVSIEAEPGRTVTATLSASNPLLIVGRSKSADLTTANRTVSREHAELRLERGAVALRDLDSTAGSFINGKRVQRGVVGLGDTVSCGKLEVRIRPAGGAPEAADAGGGGTAVLAAFEPDAELDPSRSAPKRSAPAELVYEDSPKSGPPTEPDLGDPEPAPAAGPSESEEPEVATAGALVFSFVDTDGTTGSFEVIEGGDKIVLGRGKAAGVRVKHRTVSREHCSIVWRGGKAEVTDMQSSAGTYVGGRKIRRQLVGPGQVVAAGKLEMTITSAGELAGGPGDSTGESAASAGPRTGPWTISFTDIEGEVHPHRIGPGDEPITIGRGKAATIRVPETTAGRLHCEVSYVDGGLAVRDLESRNGTYVNDTKIQQRQLAPGDVLKCGTFPLAVEGPKRAGAIEDWEENWDDAWTDLNDMTPPSWHLLYSTDEGRIDHETLSPETRILAVGSDPDCEICVADRGVEADHCEVTWEEGILIVTDLDTEVGTQVRDMPIKERVLKNGDIIAAAEFRLHVVRGAASGKTASGKHDPRSEEVQEWAERFTQKDSSLCLVYCYGDEEDPSFPDIGKVELTLWADGETRVEVATEDARVRSSGRVHEGVVTLLFAALTHAGYPTVPASTGEEEACPVEISVYQDDYEVTALISRKNMNRIEPYREAIELLRAIAYELECSAEEVS